MNDQLKKYVQQNREDFDHLDPSESIFLRIKNELRVKPEPKKIPFRLSNGYRWMVAASVLLVSSLTYLIFSTEKQLTTLPVLTKANSKPFSQPRIIGKSEKPVANQPLASIPPTNAMVTQRKYKPVSELSAIYQNLVDSASASARLGAVLKFQQLNIVSEDIINRLASTLNNDPNSNVRLAVVDLLGRYIQDNYVKKVFVQSLSHQKDPLVQLGLINLLGQTNDAKLDEKLYALTNDPETYEQVRDQAYFILLNQNKL